jgi:hypothetical protein
VRDVWPLDHLTSTLARLLSIWWGCVVLQRVVRALAVAGGFLVVAGLAYGLWKVGDDCGSGWAPDPTSMLGREKAGCAEALVGRANQAWFFIVLGATLIAGAIGLTREATPAAVPVAAEKAASE